MLLLRKIISVISPETCIVCDDEGWLLCDACAYSEIPLAASTCYSCGEITKNFATCKKCRRKSPLSSVWIVTKYDATAKKLVGELKFNSRRGGAEPIARLCNKVLPIPDKSLVTHLPTSSFHIRQRGFDQSKLIAKKLAHRKYNYAPPLRRIKKIHQIGANKKQRQEQLAGAFVAVNRYLIKNAKILLVDDVATTGASLEEAAKTLKKAGAKEVSAVVFART
jgi:ComF family protein